MADRALLIERLDTGPGCCLQPSQFPCEHRLDLLRADRLCGPPELLCFSNPIPRLSQAVKHRPERAPDDADDRVLVWDFLGHARLWNHLETSLVVLGAQALDYALLARPLCSIASHGDTP